MGQHSFQQMHTSMNLVLRTVVVDRDAAIRREIKSVLAGTDLVCLVAEYSDCSLFPASADLPDVVVVGMDSDTDSALDLINRLARQVPRCGICAVSRSSDGQLILRAIRAGAKEFLTLPVQLNELVTGLRSATGLPDARGRGMQSCQTIAVAGAAGGVGSTSLAVNLASILAASPERAVVLVDLDLTLGDADVYLDTIHEFTLADLTRNVERLDAELVRRSLARHKSGLYLLPRPVELDDANLVTPEPLRRVLGLLKATHSHVLIDLSKGYSALDMSALACCDTVLLVTQLDLPCLRNVVRLLKSFRPVPGLSEKVKLVVNRAMPESETIRLKRAEEIVGREFFWQIPNDYRLMVDVRNNGVPLIAQAPRADITQSLFGMAQALCGDGKSGDKTAGRSGVPAPMFGKWFKFLSSMANKSSLAAH